MYVADYDSPVQQYSEWASTAAGPELNDFMSALLTASDILSVHK